MVTIGFIGGSGLAQGLEDILENSTRHDNVTNKFGKVSPFWMGTYGKNRIIILSRHGDKDFRSPARLVREKGYEANIWQLAELGVEELYGLTAVGSLDLNIPLADQGIFVVPNQYIRGFAASQHSFESDAKCVFTNMSKTFDESLRQRLIEATKSAFYLPFEDGTYIYNGGDTFETSAEIRVLDRMTKGEPNRLVGMTTVPELILAKQLGIPFAAIASNVNYAEGLSTKMVVSHDQTLKIMETAAQYLVKIVGQVIKGYQ